MPEEYACRETGSIGDAETSMMQSVPTCLQSMTRPVTSCLQNCTSHCLELCACREVDSSHALVVCSDPAEAVVLLRASLESKWMLQPFEMVSCGDGELPQLVCCLL